MSESEEKIEFLFATTVGSSDKQPISLDEWSEAMGIVDDTMEEQLVEGWHCFSSNGKAWHGSSTSKSVGVGRFPVSYTHLTLPTNREV